MRVSLSQREHDDDLHARGLHYRRFDIAQKSLGTKALELVAMNTIVPSIIHFLWWGFMKLFNSFIRDPVRGCWLGGRSHRGVIAAVSSQRRSSWCACHSCSGVSSGRLCRPNPSLPS